MSTSHVVTAVTLASSAAIAVASTLKPVSRRSTIEFGHTRCVGYTNGSQCLAEDKSAVFSKSDYCRAACKSVVCYQCRRTYAQCCDCFEAAKLKRQRLRVAKQAVSSGGDGSTSSKRSKVESDLPLLTPLQPVTFATGLVVVFDPTLVKRETKLPPPSSSLTTSSLGSLVGTATLPHPLIIASESCLLLIR